MDLPSHFSPLYTNLTQCYHTRKSQLGDNPMAGKTLDTTELQDLRRRIYNGHDYSREEVRDAISTLRSQRMQSKGGGNGSGSKKKSSSKREQVDLSDLIQPGGE